MDRLQRRIEIQSFLENLVKPFVSKNSVTRHVYYNPPTGFQMEYPCIVYRDSELKIIYADNIKYLKFFPWDLTVMTRDPESADIAPLIEELPYCSLSGSPYIMDGISHRRYTLYW